MVLILHSGVIIIQYRQMQMYSFIFRKCLNSKNITYSPIFFTHSAIPIHWSSGNTKLNSVPSYCRWSKFETSLYTWNEKFAGSSLPAKTKALQSTNQQTNQWTNQRTNRMGQMDQPTKRMDTPSCRVLTHALKKARHKNKGLVKPLSQNSWYHIL